MTMPGETWQLRHVLLDCMFSLSASLIPLAHFASWQGFKLQQIGFHMCSKQWISLGCSATASTRRHMSKVFAERLLTSQKGVSS